MIPRLLMPMALTLFALASPLRAQTPIVTETPFGSTGDYDQVKAITFSEDSRHVAFLGLKDQKQIVVSDGKIVGTYDWVVPDSLILSPFGRHLAYLIQEGNDMAAVVDGKIVGKGYF